MFLDEDLVEEAMAAATSLPYDYKKPVQQVMAALEERKLRPMLERL